MSDDNKLTNKADTRPATRSKSSVSSLSLGNADDALTLAKELQKFVKANQLTSTIQGKQFPNVEAWQFAGSLLGLSPMLESIEDRSTESEIKWNATVKVVSLKTGNEVGRGFATCSNKEHTKKHFADYAICSMAQTRAVGKAYRLSLGWLMKAAGYEATPAEEMTDLGTDATVEPAPKKLLPAASAPASIAPAVSGAAAENGELETVREQIRLEVRSHHLTVTERESTLAALPAMSLATAKKCLSKILDTIDFRPSPDGITAAKNQLRAFANANASALGQETYAYLHQRSLALTVTAVDLLTDLQQAEQHLKTPQQAAA